MLHVFSINRVKLVAHTPKVTDNKGQREYVTRKIKWLCSVQHREGYIGHYRSQYRFDDFTLRNARRSIFL